MANDLKLLVLSVLYSLLVVSDIWLTVKKLKRQGLATELNIWVRYWSKQIGIAKGVPVAITIEAILWLFIALVFQAPVFLGILVGFRLCLLMFQAYAESLA